MANRKPPAKRASEPSTRRVRAFLSTLRGALRRLPRAFRFLCVFRFLRVLGKPAVFLPIAFAAFLGFDAWTMVAISGWKAEAENLEAKAVVLGESVAAVNTLTAENEAEIAMLAEQADGLSARTDELEDEFAAEDSRWRAYRKVAYMFADCAVKQHQIFEIINHRGIPYVTELTPIAVNICYDAHAAFNTLLDEDS